MKIKYNHNMTKDEVLNYVHNNILEIKEEDLEVLLNTLCEQSYNEGYDEGYDNGHDFGFDSGYNVGLDDGFFGVDLKNIWPP